MGELPAMAAAAVNDAFKNPRRLSDIISSSLVCILALGSLLSSATIRQKSPMMNSQQPLITRQTSGTSARLG
jgi:hypothetical protein